MGAFNIDFNQFKPSSRGGTPMSTPTPQLSVSPMTTPTLPKVAPIPNQQPTVQPPTSKGKIFSGNIFQKLLDVPMSVPYAIAGFNKGAYGERARQNQENDLSGNWRGKRLVSGLKGILPGIQNRSAFGNQPEDVNPLKELGVQNEGVQSAANLVANLASPSLPIGKVGSVLSKVPGVSKLLSVGGKVASKVGEIAKATPAIYKPIEVVAPYFRRPEVGKMVTGAEEVATGRINTVFNQIKKMATGLTTQEQQEVGRIIEGASSKNTKLVAIAKEAQKMGTDIGQELINEGLLPKNTKLGNYLPHIFEQAKQKDFVSGARSSLPKLIGNFFKKRTGAEGYLPEFAPSLFKGLGTEVKDLTTNTLFKDLATKYGTRVTTKASVPAGYVWAKDIVKNPQLQKLFKRTAIPSDVAEYMARIYDVPKNSVPKQLLNVWKQVKTIFNPAYHARNLVSNQILSDMQTGRGAVNTAVDTVKNLRSMTGRGSQEFVNAAKEAGLIGRTTVNQGFQELQGASGLSAKQNMFQRAGDKIRSFQSGSEEVSKLTVFRSVLEDKARELGTTVENVLQNKSFVKEAANKAEEAIFSPYRISQGERNLVSQAIPFYSFARQAIPFTLKTLINHPDRITKYTKVQNAVEDLSGKNKVSPENRTDTYKNQIQLPGKDKNSKTSFFDPTYIYPWGNIGQENGDLPFGLSFNPFVKEAFQQTANLDTYTKKPITESKIPRVRFNERVGHVAKLVEPTLLTNLRTKVLPAFQGKPDQYGKDRTRTQALLETLLGFKTSKTDTGAMQQSVQKSKAYDLRGYKKEEETILTDPNMKPEEKARRIQELKALYGSR